MPAYDPKCEHTDVRMRVRIMDDALNIKFLDNVTDTYLKHYLFHHRITLYMSLGLVIVKLVLLRILKS